jgi:hypothetical protein
MKLVMLRNRSWQNVGREEQLQAGETYDLPAPVAMALIATGAGAPVDDRSEAPAPVDRTKDDKKGKKAGPVAVRKAPENAAAAPTETAVDEERRTA